MLLTLLALAVPPAFAISDDALNTVATGPAAIEVSTTLDSCGTLDNGIVCKLDVSFDPIENAASYSATITRADGSVIDYGTVGPGGTSLWVPYVGSGNYSVRITAYGEPESPDDADGRGDVLAVGSSNEGRNRGEARDKDRDAQTEIEQDLEADVTGRGPEDTRNSDASGAPETDVGAAPAAPAAVAPRELLPLFERALDALRGADALVIVTEWHEFREPDFGRMRKLMRAPVVFDGRNLYDPKDIKSQGFTYLSVGR